MDSEKNLAKLLNDCFLDRNKDFRPLSKEEIQLYQTALGDSWHLTNNQTYLERQIRLANYRDGVNLTIWLANLAEEINHHPDILLEYKKVIIRLTTHNVQSLSLADFVVAAKIEEYLENIKNE